MQTDDLISRRKALTAIADLYVLEMTGARESTFNDVFEAIKALPSEPERKSGKWIDDNCSICGQYVYHGDARNYCPNCGAKMLGDIYTSENIADDGKI